MSEVKNTKCLFLLTELSGYIVACLNKLADEHPVEVHLVRWPVNAVAPFQFAFDKPNMFIYERKELTDEQLMTLSKDINPQIILCSGWMDKGYNRICRFFNSNIPVVLGLDNPWRGTLKQHVAALAGPFSLPRYYSKCWVPGITQKTYALKLGFKPHQIKTGAYSCDFEAFHKLYHQNREAKIKAFPKKIIFVGRYTRLKGTLELWNAFVEFQKQQPCEWELWCLGKGELENQFPVHDKIRNFGFIQPSEMHKFIAGCGVFILPSHYEHWGVVVHEFGAAGFPLICTSTTGAANAFLINEKNGYIIPPVDTNALVDVFKKITNLSTDELIAMGDKSAELASHITPSTWSDTFMDFLNN